MTTLQAPEFYIVRFIFNGNSVKIRCNTEALGLVKQKINNRENGWIEINTAEKSSFILSLENLVAIEYSTEIQRKTPLLGVTLEGGLKNWSSLTFQGPVSN